MKITNKHVRVIEVGPRDGFQNIDTFIPTDVKLQTIRHLLHAGVKEIEITSFVHPKAIPQMEDAVKIATKIVEKYGNDIAAMTLVPNAKGAENAQKVGIGIVNYVISASEKHNKANVNREVKESFTDLLNLIKMFPRLHVRLDIATAFGCPFLGKIPEETVLEMVDRALEYGVKEVVLCDTIGVANPAQVENLIESVKNKFKQLPPLALHLHDTRGMGLANVVVALQAGIDAFEVSIGGLGGCPYAPGASGNTATEDLLNMLTSMNVETGIDLGQYLQAVDYVRKNIRAQWGSHMANVSQI